MKAITTVGGALSAAHSNEAQTKEINKNQRRNKKGGHENSNKAANRLD